MRIIVCHSHYSCQTSCCGHRISLRSDNDAEVDSAFSFSSPDGMDPLAYAKKIVAEEFGEEHVKDLDWDHCEIVDDCEG